MPDDKRIIASLLVTITESAEMLAGDRSDERDLRGAAEDILDAVQQLRKILKRLDFV